MDIKILYEDNHLLVAEKPVNVLVQADGSVVADMLTLLKQYLKEKYNKPGEVFLGLVHRLDRPVGGVMVFARTSKAASRLSEQVRSRKIEKYYLAAVQGKLPAEGAWIDYLYKDSEKNQSFTADKNHPEAKEARLTYTCLENAGDISLAAIHLETGRHHQIRVQFKEHGHPLLGDRKYGGYNKTSIPTVALWAWKLVFEHPTKKEMMEFVSKPPLEDPWTRFKSLSSL